MGNYKLDIEEQIEVNAPIESVFDALVHRFSDGNYTHENTPMPMKMELWPGGRWYRDLGEGRGHLWGHIQEHQETRIAGDLRAAFHVISRYESHPDPVH